MGWVRMTGRFARLVNVLAIGMLGELAEAQAPETHGVLEPVRREVLALTTTKQEDRSSDFLDHVHDRLQMPLNYLGMVVREHDLRSGPPDHVDLRRVRAIITFFQGNDEPCPWLWPWLEAAVAEHDLQIIHFGDFGPLAPPDDEPTEDDSLTRWLARFGLAWDPGFVGHPMRVGVEFAEPELSCWESIPSHTRSHTGPWSWGPDNVAWVRTSDRDALADLRTPIVTGPWGGIALLPWAFYEGTVEGALRWHIDPFEFFSDSLGLEGVPIPEPSVLNGRRMLVLHIDGDGFESLSTVRHGQLSAKIMLDDVLDRFRLPVTVSVIIASLTNDITVERPTDAMLLAREILNRPFVEPATHAVLHPLNWRRTLGPKTPPRTVTWYPGLANFEHDMVAEVRDSVRFINERLLDGTRKCQLVLWSGMCNPTEDAVRAAVESGCWNMNGGEFRWDALSNSAGFVSPWGKQVGDQFQVYCGAANENVFEGFYSTMPGTFWHVDTTLRNSGAPRILKPANVYFHFYSAERPARLQALVRLIERWAYEEPTIPVHGSAYASAVHSAQTGCRIYRTPSGWLFEDFGACKTVRIRGDNRRIDWSRSTGLIGARHMLGAQFVHLAKPDAELVWARDDRRHAHIEQTNHPVTDVKLEPSHVEFVSSASFPRYAVLAGFPPGTDVAVVVDGVEQDGRTDDDGRLELRLANPGTNQVQVRIR